MDSVLKTFPVALLFRGVFPGGFFLISFEVSCHGWKVFKNADGLPSLAVCLTIAVFSGVAIYTVHRSIIYPAIEFCLDGRCPSSKCPLIKETVVTRVIERWMLDADEAKGIHRLAEHISGWADYAHLQYTSSLSIGFGMVIAFLASDKSLLDPLLMFLSIALFLCGFISDWRLQHVLPKAVEHINKIKRDSVPKVPHS